MILSITYNPSVDRTLFVSSIILYSSNRVHRTETDAGGKGINVARVCAEFGIPTLATGFLGGATGEMVKCVLRRESVDYEFVEVQGETRININIEDEKGDMPTTFHEAGPKVSPEEIEKLEQFVEKMLPESTFVVTGGALPPGMPDDSFVKLIRKARKYEVPVIVDTEGEKLRKACEEKPFMIKPNLREAEELLGRPLREIHEIAEAAEEIHRKGITIVVISMGAAGAVLASEEGVFHAIPPAIKAVSTIGSGDSLVAGVLYGLTRKKHHVEVLQWGVAAGTATALTDGAEIARKPVIESLFGQVHLQELGTRQTKTR